MAQLISNVLMQPKPTDAVERPLTLVEKLQAKVDRLKAIGASQDKIETASECLNIAQQHSDWISVDERLPSDWSVVLCYGVPFEWDKTSKPNSNIFCAVYVAEYDRWSVGYSAFGDTSTLKVTHWQPLPQPPREPQYLISKYQRVLGERLL